MFDEARLTLIKAINDLYARYLTKTNMPSHVFIKNVRHTLRGPLLDMVKTLRYVNLDEGLDANLPRVREMSKDLRKKIACWELAHNRKCDDLELKYHGAVISAGSKMQKNAVEESRRTIQEMGQLERFQRHSNANDEKILAETATLKMMQEGSGTPCDCMIASYDSGFFSPRRIHGVVSDTVTREIFKRFGVLCGRPDQISRRLGDL